MLSTYRMPACCPLFCCFPGQTALREVPIWCLVCPLQSPLALPCPTHTLPTPRDALFWPDSTAHGLNLAEPLHKPLQMLPRDGEGTAVQQSRERLSVIRRRKKSGAHANKQQAHLAINWQKPLPSPFTH